LIQIGCGKQAVLDRKADIYRVTGAISLLAEKYPGKAIAIVSHGDICAALLGFVADTSIYESPQKHTVATGSVSEIIITDMGWFLPRQGYKPVAP